MSIHQFLGLVHTVEYDPKEYPFKEWACSALRVSDLGSLHLRKDLLKLTRHDAMLKCRGELAAAFGECSQALMKFFSREIAPVTGVLGGAYQTPPMFRVHLHLSPSSSAWHRDCDYGMPTGRLNLWLPLTKVWGNNSLWIHKPTPTPIKLDYGEALVFDSATLIHGSVSNDTGSTRVSLDSRFNPELPATS